MATHFDIIKTVDSLIAAFRNRGMAGYIVSAPIDTLKAGEQAVWTGAKYELAIVSAGVLPKVELRNLDNGLRTLVYEAVDSRRCTGIIVDFLTREG